ncbi:MAG: hypothetical protein V1855_03800 [bacterium]
MKNAFKFRLVLILFLGINIPFSLLADQPTNQSTEPSGVIDPEEKAKIQAFCKELRTIMQDEFIDVDDDTLLRDIETIEKTEDPVRLKTKLAAAWKLASIFLKEKTGKVFDHIALHKTEYLIGSASTCVLTAALILYLTLYRNKK